MAKWETMASWNPQIPEGWAGRDGLLYDRDEEPNPAYEQPEIQDVTVINGVRARQRLCQCGCGELAPRSGNEFLSYVPGHNRSKHWRQLRAVA